MVLMVVYSCTGKIKNRRRRLDSRSILAGNRKAVLNMVNAIAAYLKQSKMEVCLMLQDIDIGNLEAFEKFARVINYQLADFINNMNRKMIKARVEFLKTDNDNQILKVQEKYNFGLIEFFKTDNDLKEIIIKYLRLVISRLSRSYSLQQVRIARQLKKLRRALIKSNWEQFLNLADKINHIEIEGYHILSRGLINER